MQGLLDFDVAIESLTDGYRARVVASPAGEAHADFVLPFTDKDLKILILEVAGSIGRARRKVRRIQTDERRLLEAFGGQLFQAVFSGTVYECLGRSRLVADSRGAGLRIRLRLPEALANVPWEYLYDAEYGFIGLSPETALVRYVELPAPVSPFPVSPPLRVLAMISAPVDVPELQSDEEWGKLNDALHDLTRRGLVQAHRLEAGTLAALQRPLRLSEYHVLHFMGHGVYDDTAQDGALALEGPDRKMRLVTGRDLGMMIRGHRSLRLVVLNACEGARSASDDPLGGVAQALVRQGIPAVIAMQFEISDPAALVFSRSFYQAIADDLPIDVAMVEARKAMFAEGHEVEWATPVLYLRSPDGRVFTMGQIPDDAERRAREDAERQAQEDLVAHYALACAAAEAQDWDQALIEFTMVADVDPGYRDVQERKENARNQQQIARWQAEEQARREAQEAARRKAEEQGPAAHPKLELSTLAVDFGRIRVGSNPKPRRVTMLHGGKLNVRITSAPEWIQAQHTGDTLTLRPDPKAPGSLIGDVQIDSNGGSARIRVTAIVDSPGISPTRGYYQGYKLGTWWQRVGAHLIDWLPLIPGIVIWEMGSGKHLSGIVAIGVLVTAAPWLYNRCYLQGRTGQSWGKRAMKLKLIAMSDKEPTGIWMTAIRDMAHFLDFLILYLGFLLPILDARRQTLADKAMRTVVISLEA